MNTSTSTRSRKSAPEVPHSWDLSTWDEQAPTVWPNSSARASWIVRAYRKQLVEHGALTRVGKRIVILGRGYAKFLEKQMPNVGCYESNNPEIGRADAA